VTASELSKTLSQKMVTTAQVQQEKEEAIFESNLLVKLNVAVNFLLKISMTVNSIFQIYIYLYYNYGDKVSYEYVDYFLYFVVDLYGGDFFENLADFLYFLSLSLNCVFFYNFDRMFKFYFRKLMKVKETKPSSKTQTSRAAAKTAANVVHPLHWENLIRLKRDSGDYLSLDRSYFV
jgi:hypothetical protein